MNDEEEVLFSSFRVHRSSFSKSFLVKIDQLNRRRGGFKTFVTQLDSSTIDCLVNRVGSYNSKNHRNSCLQTCLRNAAGDFTRDVLEVWSLATNNCTEADDRIKLFGPGKF